MCQYISEISNVRVGMSYTNGCAHYILKENGHEKICNSKYWMCAYKVEKNTILIIIAVYRSPRYRKVELCDEFDVSRKIFVKPILKLL